jgi:prepilin-type N-terminal cleavage/methylation domain-containing protein
MISNFKFQISNSQRGFSLMELIVVLALFMLIIGVVVNMFISIVGAQKRILGEEELLNQVSYVQEYASRAIRSAVKDAAADCLTDGAQSYPGYMYLLTHYNSQLAGYEGIKFISKDNVCEEFFVDPADGLLKESKSGSRPQNILSSKFALQYVKFVINGDSSLGGASSSDAMQPRVTMVLSVQNQTAGAPDKVFQTTVSQRNLNIPAP